MAKSIASAHYAYLRNDGQAELAWVTCWTVKWSPKSLQGNVYGLVKWEVFQSRWSTTNRVQALTANLLYTWVSVKRKTVKHWQQIFFIPECQWRGRQSSTDSKSSLYLSVSKEEDSQALTANLLHTWVSVKRKTVKHWQQIFFIPECQ